MLLPPGSKADARRLSGSRSPGNLPGHRHAPSGSVPLEMQATQNLFLAALKPEDRQLLLERCRPVALPLSTVLYEPEVRPALAYFLTAGIASVVTSMPEGVTVEVGVVGNEGVVGSLFVLGPTIISTRCLMQLEGAALAIPLSLLAHHFNQSEGIRSHLLEFVQSQTAFLGQIAACHRLHLAEERLARWLLMVQDRIHSNRLELTQEFLGNMLGSRRTTVTKAAGVLEQAGAITFRRGTIDILDRDKLIASACSCYPIVQQLLECLYDRGFPSDAA